MSPYNAILIHVCSLSDKSLLYSDIRYPTYLKSDTRHITYKSNFHLFISIINTHAELINSGREVHAYRHAQNFF